MLCIVMKRVSRVTSSLRLSAEIAPSTMLDVRVLRPSLTFRLPVQ